jgi:hypothetical protein
VPRPSSFASLKRESAKPKLGMSQPWAKLGLGVPAFANMKAGWQSNAVLALANIALTG